MFKFLRFRDDEGDMSVAAVIGVVILVVIALLMLPVVQDAVTDAQNDTSDGTQDTLLGMITLFYILGVVLAAVGFVLKQSNII